MIIFNREREGAEPLIPELVKSETVFRAKIFDIVRNQYEDRFERIFVHHPGAVAVVASTTQNRLLLIRQFRAPAARWLWEIPAGTLEAGEGPAECARRELEEETGFVSQQWEFLLPVFLAPGYSSEIIHLYRARNAWPHPESRQGDEDEEIYLHEITRLEARRLLASGSIADAKTIIGLQQWLSEPECGF
ncbi:MAG TPA: NUDIX hydrolase [Atribacteraceae bacterium]|nr:NUDIX hydrolase [Atribacteraceae bacterium]